MNQTPMMTGDLRSSLTVVSENDSEPHGDTDAKIGPHGKQDVVVVGSDLPYAAAVHELTDSTDEDGNPVPVKWSEPGTGFKFLERGTHAAAGNIEAIIGGAIKNALK